MVTPHESNASRCSRVARGGCGGLQPTFKKTGLKIEVEFPASDTTLAGDRKRQLSALEVYIIFYEHGTQPWWSGAEALWHPHPKYGQTQSASLHVLYNQQHLNLCNHAM